MKNQKLLHAVCAQTIDLSGAPPEEVRLLPAGEFRAKDGRPTQAKSWIMNEELAQTIVENQASLSDKFLIDYDHQTQLAQKTGVLAKAAGWASGLEWRADGLFAVGIEWTKAAAQAITEKEYRYISPVISYLKTGEIVGVKMASIVNYPALDGLTDLAAMGFDFENATEENNSMKTKQLALLSALAGIAVSASDQVEDSQIDEAIAELHGVCGENVSALSALKAAKEKINTLSAELAAVPSKFVTVEQHATVVAELYALKDAGQKSKCEGIIAAALASGKLKPGQKELAEKLAAQDLETLSAFIESLSVPAALGDQQKPSGDGRTATLSAEQDEVRRSLGQTVEVFISGLEA